MNLFKGKTLIARLILCMFGCLAYTVMAFYFIPKYLINDELYYVYFIVTSVGLAVLYAFTAFIIHRTTTRPINEILKFSKDIKDNNVELKNSKTYRDVHIEALNENFNDSTAQVAKINKAGHKFIHSLTYGMTQTVEKTKNVLTKILNGKSIDGDIVAQIEELNRISVKLNLYKEIAMLDSGNYSIFRENTNVITTINDVIRARQEHILKKKLFVDCDFSESNVFGRVDENSLKKILGNIIDICVLQLLDTSTFKIEVKGNEKNFFIGITPQASIIPKSQLLVLYNDYTSEDMDNIVILKLLIAKKLCLINGLSFIAEVNNEGNNIFKIVG